MVPWIVFIAVAVLAAIPSGRFTAKYAAQRGRSERTWFLLGVLLFPLSCSVDGLGPPARKVRPPQFAASSSGSAVNRNDKARIAGAANTTIGSIAAHAISQETVQC